MLSITTGLPYGRRAIHVGMAWALVLALAIFPVLITLKPINSAISGTPQFDLSKLSLSFVPAPRARVSPFYFDADPRALWRGPQSTPALFQVQYIDSTINFSEHGVVFSLPSDVGAPAADLAVEFTGANPQAVIGVDELPGDANYFIGQDPSTWRTSVSTFGGIVYQNLYPGIDLHYSGMGGKLKGTYYVAAGASPALIRWQHRGAAQVAINPGSGSLEVTLTNGRTVIEAAPIAWQDTPAGRINVPVKYTQSADGALAYALGAYNIAYPLVIDPTLIFSGVIGGGDLEDALGVAVDDDGFIYLTGISNSTDFPVVSPFEDDYQGWGDVFVVKIDPEDGNVIYSTYLGGGEDDGAYTIAVDGSGQVYIAGDTGSEDFPVYHAAQNACALTFGGCVGDAFVAKLNPSGNALLYSSYLGGSNPESAESLAVTANGKLYIAGTTFSSNFPTKAAYQTSLRGPTDAFVTIFDTTKTGADSLIYSSYLGGSQADYGGAIAVAGDGRIFIAGNTYSTNFPTQSPLQASNKGAGDVFLTKMNTAGSALVYSTYLGGAGKDYLYGLALNDSGAAFLAGSTESNDFPRQSALQASYHGNGDAFVAQVSATGSALLYSTYLGGAQQDIAYGIAVNGEDHAYVAGETRSGDFPDENTLHGYQGAGDAFVAKLDADGSELLYSTFLGGSDEDAARSIALGVEGLAYIAGMTFSDDFPEEGGATFSNAGGAGAFVAVIEDEGENPPAPPAPDLSGSTKTSSQYLVKPDEQFTYTIKLLNSGDAAAVVDVTDAIPAALNYVAGSVTGGGVYISGSRSITWNDINVSTGAQVNLTFQAIPAASVDHQTLVMNTAEISVSGTNLERSAEIALVPEDQDPPAEGADLKCSLKLASQLTLAPDDTLSYIIRLINSGSADATATVIDSLPDELSYVAGSANNGGSYDSGAHKLTWSDIQVSAGNQVDLKFDVEPASVVEHLTLVTNTASITYDGETLQRSIVVSLLPQPAGKDVVHPNVQSLTIGDQDVLASRETTLHIAATDNEEVRWMYLREWTIATHPSPRWVITKTSGWVPFQADYPWTLTAPSGVHYIGVWVADESRNISTLDLHSLDFASLLLPNTSISQIGYTPGLVYYDAGVEVNAVLTTSSGNADLFVWYPGSFLLPDKFSIQPGTTTDRVRFTTPAAGIYMFLVTAVAPTTYSLSITPGGGPRAWNNTHSSLGLTLAAEIPADESETLQVEPIFSQIGLYPLGSQTAAMPGGPVILYLPVIR